jgi:hypothetical protein
VPRFYCLGAFFAPEKESDFLLSPLYSWQNGRTRKQPSEAIWKAFLVFP